MTNLYLKYRPNHLSEIVGNKTILPAIEEYVSDKETCPHAFMLHGPTGCGKTTIARIIAADLGCVGSDLHELDSAHFRGIDTIRELRADAMYQPMSGPVSVWIMDECHKMTSDAQNALLKILEDTPKHVYFILATTDPHLVIKTIRGRCIEFRVDPLNEPDMEKLLRKVVVLEQEELEQNIYEQILISAEGLPRNALQILDKVLRVSPKKRLKAAKQADEEYTESIALCRALIDNSSWGRVSKILNGLKGKDAESIRRHVLAYAQSVLLRKENDKAAMVLEEFADNFWNSGFPGLALACYAVTKN